MSKRFLSQSQFSAQQFNTTGPALPSETDEPKWQKLYHS